MKLVSYLRPLGLHPRRSCAPGQSTGSGVGRAVALAAAVLVPAGVPPAAAAGDANPRAIDRGEFAGRLEALWRGTCIANWTGLRAEGTRNAPPFFTDADWGTFPFADRPWLPLDYYLWGNPWNADDDTDIEYVYLHLCTQYNTLRLTPAQIAAGWTAHINRSIWVSNASARVLMTRGVRPPMTAMAQGLAHSTVRTSDDSLMIDAQLTTELFGLLAPGMPQRALEIADLPIRTTAAGHAVHAAQFYVLLYSLAPVVDPALPPTEQALWLTRSARAFIPDTSKAADIIDFVVAQYLADPNPDHWEAARDRVYERYQRDAAANGFAYRAWYESSMNLAAGVLSLLYGELDYRRTLRIATSAGWDCDNQAATIAGLVAFLRTPAFNADLGWTAGTFLWSSTRDGLIDYLPANAAAEDSFSLMAARMMPLIDAEVRAAGGLADVQRWLLPPSVPLTGAGALAFSPTRGLMGRSANHAVRGAGGSVVATVSVAGTPQPGFGSADAALAADGVEHDFRGIDPPASRAGAAAPGYVSTQRAPASPDPVHTLTVTYDRPVTAHTLRLITGDRFTPPTFSAPATIGGGCPNPAFFVRIGAAWEPAPLATPFAPSSALAPFAIVDAPLSGPVLITGVRVECTLAGPETFITVLELDALAPAASPAAPTFDRNGDGAIDAEDLYLLLAASGAGADLTGDGVGDVHDWRLLRDAVRFTHPTGDVGPRR